MFSMVLLNDLQSCVCTLEIGHTRNHSLLYTAGHFLIQTIQGTVLDAKDKEQPYPVCTNPNEPLVCQWMLRTQKEYAMYHKSLPFAASKHLRLQMSFLLNLNPSRGWTVAGSSQQQKALEVG